MNIHYIAQSGFIIEESDVRIAIDVWPNNPINPIQLSDIPKVNHVFISHDHFDHDMETGIQLALRDGATFHSCGPIAELAKSRGVTSVHGSNIGGSYISVNVEVYVTNAIHSSNTGFPVGFIIKINDRTIYHMGDTDYFLGIKDIANLYKIDILFIPIGGTYTMNPTEAARAVADLQPRLVIPMHYNTLEEIKQDPEEFKNLVRDVSEVKIINPGEILEV